MQLGPINALIVFGFILFYVTFLRSGFETLILFKAQGWKGLFSSLFIWGYIGWGLLNLLYSLYKYFTVS